MACSVMALKRQEVLGGISKYGLGRNSRERGGEKVFLTRIEGSDREIYSS